LSADPTGLQVTANASVSVKSLKADGSATPKEGTSFQHSEDGKQGGGPSKRTRYLIAAAIVVAGGVAAWLIFRGPALPHGLAAGNGRLESNEIYVATKYAGRVKDVLFNEGDTVDAGQVVAHMDTSALEAQLRQALAQITEAEDNRNVALAQVAVKQADYNFAAKQNARSSGLVHTGAVSGQEAEVDQARMLASRAELVGAQADARRTLASIDAAKATADRLRAEIKDAVLVSPLRARIETRLTEPGEVLAQGGRVFSLNDLSDVYMYVFLPESVTGKVPLGSEARIVLDAARQYPIRAYVSYVSPMAQFTPKSVETAEERHNLTFRVKLQVPKARLREFEPLVKSGLPGMGYVRFDPNAPWPKNLVVNPNVPKNLWQPTGTRVAN
jgi:HlyD family secretion protein